MDTIKCIRGRRSIRNYIDQEIDYGLLQQLLKDTVWAPSGKNRQPWKFKIVTDKELMKSFSKLSINLKWLKDAPCFIFVFLDKSISYDYIKDVQSCGALIQTMLLCATSYGLSSCWVGEILNISTKIMEFLEISDVNFELMALVVLGYSEKETVISTRKNIDDFII